MHYAGRRFEGEEIELDGNRFEGCIFRNCKLVYEGGAVPELIGNDLEHCHFKLEGAAKHTIAFCRTLVKAGLDQAVETIIAEMRKPHP
jgi:hypothetical protein